MKILSVNNLNIEYKVSFGTIEAVKNVSFSVNKGESFVIVGRSGSGKSTVASAIMDLTEIDGGIVKSGNIKLENKDILKMSYNEKRDIRGKKISMIFQDPQSYLNPVVRVEKQIAESYLAHYPKAPKKYVEKKIDYVLKKVGLFEEKKRILKSYPHQLSGGQKQRILIAMAIINYPKVLIADEPTTGLDASIQKQILDLIDELKKSLGLTLIMITHNMRIAQKYADKVAVMHNGEIVEMAECRELFINPKHEYTKLLIED